MKHLWIQNSWRRDHGPTWPTNSMSSMWNYSSSLPSNRKLLEFMITTERPCSGIIRPLVMYRLKGTSIRVRSWPALSLDWPYLFHSDFAVENLSSHVILSDTSKVRATLHIKLTLISFPRQSSIISTGDRSTKLYYRPTYLIYIWFLHELRLDQHPSLIRERDMLRSFSLVGIQISFVSIWYIHTNPMIIRRC